MPASVLIELPYLPPVSWCALIWQFPIIRLEAFENYQKGGWRNRCHIAGPNGLQRLSIPLQKGKHQQTPFREVRVAWNDDWPVRHWRSIQTAYGNAPYFDHYSASLQKHFENPQEYLFDFNLGLLQWALDQLDYKGKMETTTAFASPQTEGDYRNILRPNDIIFPEWFAPQAYPQVFAERRPFLPNLSVLDLLLCCGKQSSQILAHSVIKNLL